MQFHKKHGVFEACKKVCEDFFETLKNVLFKLNRTFSITDIYAMPPVKRISMVAT